MSKIILSLAAFLVATSALASDAGPKLPDEDAGKPCISSFPFPDRLSQYVWRNWTLVPHERLAEVVGAKEGELEEIAAEMGLPRKVDVLSDWQTKGYITVLRRNWQILDYPQLIRLLGISREEMRFRLLEDDFLWGKLGRVKPKCGELAYATDASASAARCRLAEVLREEGVDPSAPEEPRFAFVKELSAPVPNWKPREGKDASPFDLRMIFSYFADYGDPLVYDDIRSYPEGLLQRLADQGINAIWFHTALRTLTTDPKYPEFGAGSERRLANLRKLCRRAAKYGIRVYIYVNEPRGLPADFFEVNVERRAMRGTDHNMRWAMCTSHPESLRWLRDALTQLFSNVPELAGMFTITMNENLSHCGSKWGKQRCPRCKDRTLEDLVAEVCRAEIEGMKRGNPKAEAVVWDWSWPQGKDGSEKGIIDALEPGSCRLMTVSEIGVPLDRGAHVSVNEYSISAPGPSERAKLYWKDASARGLKTAAKVQANVTWEICPFPYVPTMDLVAEHAVNLANSGVEGALLSWSLGCAPSPNLAAYDFIRRGDTCETLLNRLAERYYGAAAADVRKAWTAFSDGYRNYPFTYQVIYNAPVHWGSANPLYPVKTGYSATMVGIPYDDLTGWRAMYPEERWITQMEKIATGFDEGCRLFEKAVGRLEGSARTAAARELAMFRAEQLHFRSTVDQARFVQARDRGDRVGMRRIAARELAAAKSLLPLVRADSRIGYECSNHYFYVPQDLLEKVLGCRAILDGGSYSGVECDVSALSGDAAEVGGIVAMRVAERLERPNAGRPKLKVVFSLDPSLGGDVAHVEVSGGIAKIRGARPRALIYGAGVLLRKAVWTADSFDLADGSYSFKPKARLRQAYFARHFHNWYQMATADELIRYTEDLMLWGVNSVHVLFAPAVGAGDDFSRDPKVVALMDSFAALERRIHRLDATVFVSSLCNQAFRNAPQEFRGRPHDDPWRHPNTGVNLCPNKPGALAYQKGCLRTLVAEMKKRCDRIDGFRFWPYDEGGCSCEQCRPWGGNGYVKTIDALLPLVREAYPDAKVAVSTWYFTDEDWKTFYGWLAPRKDIDYLVVDDYYKYPFPRYPLTHPVPNGVPMCSFPEISMYGRCPWGGDGANPYPQYMYGRFLETKGKVMGFSYYSEGLFEDVNKAVVTTLYSSEDPNVHYQDALEDYARYELGLGKTDDFVEFIRLLEWNLVKCRRREATEAWEMAQKINATLRPRFAASWRWRILCLRAQIDFEHCREGGGVHTPAADAACLELCKIYKASPTPDGYGDDLHQYVRPPARQKTAERQKLDL